MKYEVYVENFLSNRGRAMFWGNLSLWPWPLDPKMYRCLPLIILYLCMIKEASMLRTFLVLASQQCLGEFVIMTLTFDPKIYRSLSLIILYQWRHKKQGFFSVFYFGSSEIGKMWDVLVNLGIFTIVINLQTDALYASTFHLFVLSYKQDIVIFECPRYL